MKRIFVLLALAQLISFAAEARILHIPADYSSIQAGITASVNGDTILVEQGTYRENINFSSKSISVLSASGPDVTTIQSLNSGTPVVTITGHSELAGFTIRNGNTPNSAGGGIKVSGSTVLIHGNNIRQNVAISGGAIGIMSGANVRVIDNTIMGNSASAMGGAIYCTGSTTTEIANNIIKNNYTGISGGGIFIEYGSGDFVHHNLIIYNRAGIRGGGVLFKDSGRLENNTIAFDSCVTNTAGGVAFEERTASAINNIICRNTGYGVYAYGINPALSYNDVWNNAQGEYYGVTPGNGSITADPLFMVGTPYDFHLAAGSPCIDSGSPSSPHDPDSTVADMGAYYFNHRFAGLSFKIADTYGSQGHVIEVPLLALGYNGHPIGGLEFHIGYDQGCLEYDSLSSNYLTGADINIADGQIHLVWEDI
jgi:predicted outer membrane repeat protein